MVSKKLGRPAINPLKRKVSVSVSMTPAELGEFEAISKKHGVSRSQIVNDAMRVYKGETEEVLRHIRMELATQEDVADKLTNLVDTQGKELSKLKASQDLVGAILNPYGGPDTGLSRTEKEKARTVRSVLSNNGHLSAELQALAEGRQEQPTLPLLAQGFQAWGSWEAFWNAVRAAKVSTGSSK